MWTRSPQSHRSVEEKGNITALQPRVSAVKQAGTGLWEPKSKGDGLLMAQGRSGRSTEKAMVQVRNPANSSRNLGASWRHSPRHISSLKIFICFMRYYDSVMIPASLSRTLKDIKLVHFRKI